MKRVVAIAVVSLACLNAWGADDGAEVFIGKGVSLRREGKHAESLEAFKRAHELAPSGRTLSQMGLAEQSLHQWSDSESHLGQALESGDPWVAKNRGVLSEMLLAVKRHVGTVEVSGPMGGVVYLDGEEVGCVPMAPIRRNEGPLRVEIRHSGHVWQMESVVLGGQTVKVEIPPQPPAEVDPPASEPGSEPQPVHESDRTASFNWKTAIGSGLIGAGVAGVGLGIATLIHGSTGGCTANLEPCGSRFDGTSLGVVSSAVGAAALVSGGLLLLIDFQEQRAVSVGLNRTGVTLAGRF